MKNVMHKLNGNWSLGSVRSEYDGEVIRYGFYKKDSKPLNRCVVFVNGRSEWIEKYDFIPSLMGLPDDCGLITWDHRGQGASGGPRAYIASYNVFAADAHTVISTAIGDDIPYVIMAHSMGGLISLYGTMSGVLKPKALALSGPLLRLPQDPVKRCISQPLVSLLERAHFGRSHSGVGRYDKKVFAGNPLTHSVTAFERIKNAPYKIASVTIGWVHATFEASDFVFSQDQLAALKVPVLIMGGGEETVVDPRGFSEWAQAASKISQAPIRYELIPGARHELFNEIPRYRDWALSLTKYWFKDFLESRPDRQQEERLSP